jgi:molecular chaperone GrpE
VTERSGEEQPRVVVNDRRRIDPDTGAVRAQSTAGAGSTPAPGGPAGPPPGAGGPEGGAPAAVSAEEVDVARRELAERTADLQRVTAEYANYRKRVDRDRAAMVETATGAVLASLLPVLDDVDRARQHGDLTGAFKSVADQLEATLEKLGLQPYGEPGERFDPTLHEAVAHQTSPDVTEPTCVAVLRRGYRLGDRLLRVPLVAVAEPSGEAAPGTEPPDAASAEGQAEWFGDDDTRPE